MPYCRNCGTEHENWEQYCSNCGTAIKKATKNRATNTHRYKKAQRKNLALPLVLIALVILTVAGVITFPLLTGNDNESGEETLTDIINTELEENIRGNTVGNIANDGYVAQQGNWIYYGNDNDDNVWKFYRIRTDGSGREKLSDDASLFINVVGDWIYYCNYSDDDGKLYRIRTDGSGREIFR